EGFGQERADHLQVAADVANLPRAVAFLHAATFAAGHLKPVQPVGFGVIDRLLQHAKTPVDDADEAERQLVGAHVGGVVGGPDVAVGVVVYDGYPAYVDAGRGGLQVVIVFRRRDVEGKPADVVCAGRGRAAVVGGGVA